MKNPAVINLVFLITKFTSATKWLLLKLQTLVGSNISGYQLPFSWVMRKVQFIISCKKNILKKLIALLETEILGHPHNRHLGIKVQRPAVSPYINSETLHRKIQTMQLCHIFSICPPQKRCPDPWVFPTWGKGACRKEREGRERRACIHGLPHLQKWAVTSVPKGKSSS